MTAAGGQVLGEPMDIPAVGAYVSFTDPEGNRVSLLEPLPMAKAKAKKRPAAKAKKKAGASRRKKAAR